MSDVTITPDTNIYYPYSTIQTYTITTTGEYQITSIGGNGGGTFYETYGGVGATVVADFSLSAGDVIEVIAGSGGGDQSNAGGGGGGSFVYDETTGTLLEVAGGGGGGGLDSDGGPGQATNSGEAGSDNGGAGGTGGSGGTGSEGGGGGGDLAGGSDGAGFNGQGDPNRTVSSAGGGGGTSFINNPYESVGSGIGSSEGGYGGFGGGGGGAGNFEIEETPVYQEFNYGAGGGGGGYSGGGAGGVDESGGYLVGGGGGGGGGSYVDASATNATITAGGAPDTDENSSGAGGSVTFEFEAACYVSGTRIATATGEVRVEDLKIGDVMKTLHAGLRKIKWIGQRGYDGRFIAGNKDVLPVCIKRHAIAENVPARDLFVSPGHAICIDDALIHAHRLVNGVSITQAAAVESVTYYHIELETHEIIFAENCPAETFLGEHFRKQFQNAAAYAQLYPGDSATETMCLPRLDSGFQLHAIQQRIAARAGIATAAPEPGRLRGYLDQAGPKICYGWAQDISAPETPVCLDIMEDSRVIGRVLANLYRADVRGAGYGSGYHGFEFLLPPGVKGRIDAVRSADRAKLARPETAAARAA